jgi:hypothetical protein
MGDIQKIIRRVLESPRTITPDDLKKLLEHFGYAQRKKRSGGSHRYYFTKPGHPPIHFPHPHPGKEVKVCYVRMVAGWLRLEMPDDE